MSLFSDDELPPAAAGAALSTSGGGASLALARKYRPRVFGELIGQDHVVRAITQALTTQRLHHAYLFTGTRGVGKTTISRIFAKALNCETGITATPCGVCSACREIDSGRFVDYIEMDAASNRSVDEMTQVLEQAVYKPTAGRFKVYMIDEVHMLTNHAFNAMLKTLEEPPEYVKFVLATTDPQKVPATVLSRCLQFNLKQMPRPEIAGHLQHILTQESVAYEGTALQLIARAAAGSMRDALSLTDQAIAYSGSNVAADAVRDMLGTVDQTYLLRLLDALARNDGAALLATADEMQGRSINLSLALDDLAALLQRMAVLQVLPQALDAAEPEAAEIVRLAQALRPEDLQLYYSLALKGRQEMPLAPDEAVGFTMTLVRMLSFGLDGGGSLQTAPLVSQPVSKPASKPVSAPLSTHAGAAVSTHAGAAVSTPAGAAVSAPAGASTNSASPLRPQSAPLAVTRATAAMQAMEAPESIQSVPIKPIAEKPIHTISTPKISVEKISEIKFAAEPIAAVDTSPRARLEFTGDWIDFCSQLAEAGVLGGLPRELAMQSELVSHERTASGWRFDLRCPKQTLLVANSSDKLTVILESALQTPVQLTAEVGEVTSSAAIDAARGKAERQRAAEETAHNDALTQSLVQQFGGKIVPGSIRAVDIQ